MKQNSGGNRQTSKPVSAGNTTKPQNKDDIDSRSNEEQDTKGGDITHNTKEVKNNRQQKKQG